MSFRSECAFARTTIDPERFASCLRRLVNHDGADLSRRGFWAVARALLDTGADFSLHPRQACEWGAFLVGLGFARVASDSFLGYIPSTGDIAAIESPRFGSAGHVQGFDGQSWVSDHVQAGFWPTSAYRRSEPGFEIYRQRVHV